MPFSFNFEGVKPGPDGEEVFTDPKDPGQWSLLAQWINMNAIRCGITTITEENWHEAAYRLLLLQFIEGAAFRFGDGTKIYATAADVKLLIGYRCNATTYTRKQFDGFALMWIREHIAQQVMSEEKPTSGDLSAWAQIKARAKAWK